MRWQKSVRSIARPDARGAARRIVGKALAPKRSARRADARSGGPPRGENGACSRVTLSANETSATRRPGQPGPLVTRRKAFRPSRVSFRKGRARGGLGHTGQPRDACTALVQAARTSCAAGMEPASVVPALTTRNVRRRRRAWQRLLQPTRRGRSITRGAARRRPSNSQREGVAVDARAGPQSRESRASRPKLARAKARPSLP